MHRNRFAVFGQPVAHSRSPSIHAAFATQCGVDLDYVRIEASPEDFAVAVERFAREGGRGANVTLPHKPAAAALCTTRSERAARADAVNTLVRVDDAAGGAPRWHGDNTDGIGLVRDLRERHGSSARGDALATRSNDARVRALAWDDADDAVFDVVINSTSAARSDTAIDWPFLHAGADGWAAVDLGYGRDAAMFLETARARGAAACIDGLGMLVEQAAESFRLWHGVMPDTAPVYDLLRRELPAP